MSEEKNKKAALNVYETICQMFDDLEFKYERHDEDLVVSCSIKGEDFPMDILFIVDADRELVQLLSPMPFRISEDKRIDTAVAVAVANYGLINGSFDYDMSDGEIRFRATQSFLDSILGKEVFRYMLGASTSSIDKYNDRFFMLNKGMMTVEQFIEMEGSDE
ncbi:MAG: YbjN domain-containing protein [Oscillospiraceae bacterium]|nr:YbjN domain-containing protein [Oscillospiraceae bacterium]MBR4101955.1 YbjN domain-containing protein [Oscillospiraceae bacterium]MBR6616396.1 YbjN domain-containing protein [Oscillospiraceae bacterium]